MEPKNQIDQLSIILYDGHFDKIHYALATASAAAAIDKQVTLFFTMDACKALMETSTGHGWSALPISQQPHPSIHTASDMNGYFENNKIASFEELLSACVDLGIKFMVCEMGLKARELDAATLRQDVPIEPGGLVTFLSNASASGSIIFI